MPDTITIPDDWTPTHDAVNALPWPLRRYIHNLATEGACADTVQENLALKVQNGQLRRAMMAKKYEVSGTDELGDEHAYRTDDRERAEEMADLMREDLQNVELKVL